MAARERAEVVMAGGGGEGEGEVVMVMETVVMAGDVAVRERVRVLTAGQAVASERMEALMVRVVWRRWQGKRRQWEGSGGVRGGEGEGGSEYSRYSEHSK